jgi:predicted phage tail protein
MVKINLHGKLGEVVGKEWNLNVKSVSEAIRAIEVNSKKFYRYILEQGGMGGKYCILINEEPFVSQEELDIENPKSIMESELMIKNNNLKSLDIIPILEGSDSKMLGIITLVVGVALLAVGIPALGVLGGSGFALGFGAGSVVLLGVGLAAAGIFSLLSQPPKFEDFREIEQGGKTSYLFAGPTNVVGEGGPVPLGYGRLIVGSQAISASYAVLQINANNTSEVLRNVNPVEPIYYS